MFHTLLPEARRCALHWLPSQVCIQPRTVEQNGDVPEPQVVEEILEMTKLIPPECISERNGEQIVCPGRKS